MAMNFPGPYAVEIKYTVATYEHKQLLSFNTFSTPEPGDEFSTILAERRGGSAQALDDCVEEWADIIKPFFDDGSTIESADCYEYTPGSFERRWISTLGLDVTGTAAGTYEKANESIWTFRTVNGGLLRITLEETWVESFSKSILAAASGITGTLRDYVLSTNNWIYARDNSYPIAPLYVLFGQNEHIFKKRYRQ